MSKRQSKRRSTTLKKPSRRKKSIIDEFLSGRRFRPAFYVVLLLLCLITYYGMFDNWMFNDDFRWLKESRYDMTLGNILTYRVIEFFRPLINISFYLMERIALGNLTFHHSLNFLLHLLNSLLIFHLFSILLRRNLAAAAAIVFAVSSVHTGAVFWISARTTLLSTFFLLASFVILTANAGAAHSKSESTPTNSISWKRIAVSIGFYLLALAAKETAITGLLLILLLYFLMRYLDKKCGIHPAAVVSFAAATVVYLLVRSAVMQNFSSSAWGMGLHIPRNIAGAFLYQLYPWPFISLIDPGWGVIKESTHIVYPEILAIPLIMLLLFIGKKTKKIYGFTLAIGWTLLALAASSPLQFRFYSTASFAHNRYYYLSSIGSALLIVLLLSILWNMKLRVFRLVAAALFIIICSGYATRVHRLEKKWETFTVYYQQTVESVIKLKNAHPSITTVAVENSPMKFCYLKDAVSLRHPDWRLVEVGAGEESAAELRPCVYISFSTEDRVIISKKLE